MNGKSKNLNTNRHGWRWLAAAALALVALSVFAVLNAAHFLQSPATQAGLKQTRLIIAAVVCDRLAAAMIEPGGSAAARNGSRLTTPTGARSFPMLKLGALREAKKAEIAVQGCAVNRLERNAALCSTAGRGDRGWQGGRLVSGAHGMALLCRYRCDTRRSCETAVNW